MSNLARLALIGSVVLFTASIGVVVEQSVPPILIVILICLVIVKQRRSLALWQHGTARLATDRKLQGHGLLDARPGLLLGRSLNGPPSVIKAVRDLLDLRVGSLFACQQFFRALFRRQPAPLVRLSRAVHTAVFCPTGGGKGVSFAIPFLLSCPESTVVLDYKCENFLRTARHRRRKFGHRIVALDPFHVVTAPGKGDRLNPLDFVDPTSPDALDECRDLAEALVVRSGQEREPHWIDSAEILIASIIALVCVNARRDDRSLQTVRDVLCDPARIASALQHMTASDAWGGMLARLGHQLGYYKDKELGSTLTTTNRFLRFLDTPAIAHHTRASTFNPSQLRDGKMTVYIILPPEHMRAQSGLMRLTLGAMFRAVVKGGLQERNRVHFLLDEAASLGPFEAINDVVDKYRGYGIRLIFLYQSLGQLKKCFPDGQDQTLLSNTTQVFMGVNDFPTADAASQRSGDHTVVVTSGGTSSGRSSQTSHTSGPGSFSTGSSQGSTHGSSSNWSVVGRRLFKPEEIRALDPRIALTFVPGMHPIMTQAVRYYEDTRACLYRGGLKQLAESFQTLFAAAIVLVVAGASALAVAKAALDTPVPQLPPVPPQWHPNTPGRSVPLPPNRNW